MIFSAFEMSVKNTLAKLSEKKVYHKMQVIPSCWSNSYYSRSFPQFGTLFQAKKNGCNFKKFGNIISRCLFLKLFFMPSELNVSALSFE